MEREVAITFKPSEIIKIDGQSLEDTMGMNVVMSKGEYYLMLRCDVLVNKEGYSCDIPLKTASVIKSYLALITSPVAEQSNIMTQEVCVDGKYILKAKAIEKETHDEEGRIYNEITGYIYSIELPFLYVIERHNMFDSDQTPCKITLNLSKEDAVEFCRSLTYLHIN